MRSSNSNVYTIMEYGGFTRGASVNDYVSLPDQIFDSLEAFILANRTEKETEAIELLSLSARRGIGKIITARNYVGLITMRDGTVIEILPKIYGNNVSINETKLIFLEMLKSLKDVTFKEFNFSLLHVDKLSLLEIFIKMFLDEVSVLTKQGLKAGYVTTETNEPFYKGKLLVSKNIKRNLVNKERFFVCYDDFNFNCPENRLIKSTLLFLMNTTKDSRNHHNAVRMLTFFENVDFSDNIDEDISKCISDRNTSHYDKALTWCRVFLRGNSFTAFSGSEVALALLFPMEKIFESFVANKLQRHIISGMTLFTQDNRYSLFDRPIQSFALRPDFVIESSNRTIVLDTKWKRLSDQIRNYGISQSDMYQMYAYSKKYHADYALLVYPKADLVNNTIIQYQSENDVKVDIYFIDLRNADTSVSDLISMIF